MDVTKKKCICIALRFKQRGNYCFRVVTFSSGEFMTFINAAQMPSFNV